MQLAIDISFSDVRNIVLWKDASCYQLGDDDVKRIVSQVCCDDKVFVFVDSVDSVIDGLSLLVHELASIGCGCVVVGAARTADWNSRDCVRKCGRGKISFKTFSCPKLGRDEAEAIVRAWGRFGKVGLGRLYGCEMANAIDLFYKYAQSDSVGSEGVLFGAMLKARLSDDDLIHHLRDMISRFYEFAPSGGYSFAHCYALIAFMHCMGLEVLTPQVFSTFLGIETVDFKKMYLAPMNSEAPMSVRGGVVMTRHHAIARAAFDLFEGEFGFDFECELLLILKAVLRDGGRNVPAVSAWRYDVTTKLFEGGQRALAISTARLIYDELRTYSALTKYMWVCRECNEFDTAISMGVDFLNSKEKRFEHDDSGLRAICFELAVAYGGMEKNLSSALFSLWSLSDECCTTSPNTERIRKSVTSLAFTLAKLYGEFFDSDFANGVFACEAVVGMLPDDVVSRRHISSSVDLVRKHGFTGEGEGDATGVILKIQDVVLAHCSQHLFDVIRFPMRFEKMQRVLTSRQARTVVAL